MSDARYDVLTCANETRVTCNPQMGVVNSESAFERVEMRAVKQHGVPGGRGRARKLGQVATETS